MLMALSRAFLLTGARALSLIHILNKLGDRELLETAVKEAREAVNPENKDSYKPTTYAPYEAALAEAETLLKKNELTETEVSEAIEKLNTARDNVELRRCV